MAHGGMHRSAVLQVVAVVQLHGLSMFFLAETTFLFRQ